MISRHNRALLISGAYLITELTWDTKQTAYLIMQKLNYTIKQLSGFNENSWIKITVLYVAPLSPFCPCQYVRFQNVNK